MPVFMDFPDYHNITFEVVKKAHIADLAAQAEYDVKYHQFWVLFKRQKSGNIAEIVFEPVFNSPSCFTKCFMEKSGCT